MTRVILTRHGHVEGINPPRFRGRRDVPLSPLGQEQADALATRIADTWKNVSAILTSPMRRCVDTAGAIAKACAREEPTVVSSLLDLDYGEWEWRTYEEMERERPELFARWFATPQLMRFPKGESLQDLVARGAEVLRTVLARRPPGIVVLVGHSSINRAILLQILDQPLSAYWRLEPRPCAINEFVISANRIRLDRYNDTAHLEYLDQSENPDSGSGR